jgi:hypothetical protein
MWNRLNLEKLSEHCNRDRASCAVIRALENRHRLWEVAQERPEYPPEELSPNLEDLQRAVQEKRGWLIWADEEKDTELVYQPYTEGWLISHYGEIHRKVFLRDERLWMIVGWWAREGRVVLHTARYSYMHGTDWRSQQEVDVLELVPEGGGVLRCTDNMPLGICLRVDWQDW